MTDLHAHKRRKSKKPPGENKTTMPLLDIIMDLALRGMTLGLIIAAFIGAFLHFNQVTFGAILVIGALLGILWKLGLIEIILEEV